MLISQLHQPALGQIGRERRRATLHNLCLLHNSPSAQLSLLGTLQGGVLRLEENVADKSVYF
jgi:hypothetical protein